MDTFGAIRGHFDKTSIIRYSSLCASDTQDNHSPGIDRKEHIMDQEGLDYIKQLKKFSIGDIEALIRCRINNAGPLLMVVMNGIDAFGGVCDRFCWDNSEKRSLKFMRCKMGIDRAVASFLYLSVRNGVVHEGMPKFAITYKVDYANPEWKTALRLEGKEEKVVLNVVGLASHYLDIVRGLNCSDYKDYPREDVPKLKRLLPAVKAWVRKAFEQQTDTSKLFRAFSSMSSSDSSTKEPPPSSAAQSARPSSSESAKPSPE